MNIVLIILAYLLGSVPFGFVIAKTKGVDIRQYGSGNIGTSNVARVLGKKAAILTLLGDGLKGLLPVVLTKMFIDADGWIIAVGLATIIGHNWPIFLKFRGGKGVTTTYGAYLGIAWLPGLLTILSWMIVTAKTKKSSVAALASALCAPIFALLLNVAFPILLFAVLGMALIYIRHIDNIKRIIAGTENLLTDKIDVGQEKEDS
jgi:glycerol-3-phosphate acyltransferase PlsY